MGATELMRMVVFAATACLAGAFMHPVTPIRPLIHPRWHRATRLCDPAPQAWLRRGSAVFDSFGERAEDLCAVREAGAQRMRRSMDADGDGIVSASEVLAFARNVAAAEAAGAVQAVQVRRDSLQRVPASVLRGKPAFVAAAIYNTASMYNLLLASSMAMGDAARQLLSRLSLGAARSAGLVLLDLVAAAAFSQLFLAAALLGGGTLVSWAVGLAVPPAASGLAPGLQPWLQHRLQDGLQPALQRLSPRVAAAAALSGGAVMDAAVLGLRGLLGPLTFAAFATDTLVRNALRRGGVRGRVGFAIRQCAPRG